MIVRTTATLLITLGGLPLAVSAQLPRAAADSAWSHGDRDAAHSLYLVRLAADRDDAVARFRLALLASWAGDHDLSLAYLDPLIQKHPEDRDARTARARSIAALGDLAGAIAAVDSILTVHPDDAGALETRARFAAWERDLATSERLWRRALELDAGSPGARVGLSQVLRWQGRTLEARSIIRPAALSSDDIAVRNESDNVERLYRPRLRSAVSLEDDSDGNRITTMTGGGAFRLSDRIDVRGDGYYRFAALDAAAEDVAASGATIAVAAETASGWTLVASAGASASTVIGSSARPSIGAGVTTPRKHAVVMTLAGSRSNIDYTLPLVRNDVAVTEARVSVDARTGRDWNVGFEAGLAAFDVRSADESNSRLSGRATLSRRLSNPLSLVLSIRSFGFDRDLDGGYFDPDFYGLADAGVAWHHETTGWSLDAEVAPGLQLIGSDGEPGGAMRAAAAASYSLRPGRQATARIVFANTGVQQLSADNVAGYRYASLSLTVSWWF